MGRQFKPGQLQTGSLYNISSSFAVTASYLNGYISSFPFTGSARITGSLGVTGSISTTTQFYHSNSLDSSNRTLTDGSSNTSVNWGNRSLINSTTGEANINWNDVGTFGITTIPIIEKFDRDRISNELQDSYDTERIYVSGKILERADIDADLKDGTLVYYNTSNQRWEKFPQTNVSFPNNYLTGSLGLTCNDNSSVLLEGTITAIKNSADPTASFGPTIIDDPSIGSPLFAAGSLSNPTTDTVFSSQIPETTNDTVRILGHVIGEKPIEAGIRGYLIYFNPSNDFYKLTSGKQISAINGKNISAPNAIQADSAVTAIAASTSSFLNTLNQNLTFNGNLTLNGTASIRTLVVNQTVLSTGSNQLGDAANDTQTLYGTVVIPTGSLTITGSVRSTGGFTGSLFGTSSYAIQALSASYAANGGVTQLLAGPNISLSPTNGLGQVTVSATLSGSTIFNTATGSYGSFYSTQTQTNVAGTARSMSLNTTDITNGVSISGSTNPFNTYIKTENAGVYNIQFSAQIDKSDAGKDEIWIWLRKNGTDLTDTATSIQLTGNADHQVAAWNFFANAAANDYFQLMWYSPDANVRLHAEPAFGVVPGIPSLIVTANRVDQFLSNTGSFSGSFTGNLIGTASYATQAVSASFATTSSFIETKTVFNQPILGTGNIGFVSRSFSPSIGSNSTGETQLLQLPIPANTFNATDKLSFFAVFSKVGTATAFTVRVKLTTSSSMPAGNTSQIAQSANTTTATLYFKISRDLFISSGSLFGISFTNSTITDTIASLNPITSASFDVTQTQYLYVSAVPTTTPTADVIRLEAFEIKNI